MTLEEFNAKKSELKAQGLECAKAGELEKAESIKAELEALENDFQKAKEAMAEENALADNKTIDVVAKTTTDLGEENKIMEKIYDASSVEYKNAYLKNLLGREMTELENAAFVHTTENTPNVLPTTLADEIWDLVSEQNAILGDVTIYRTGTILEVVKHTEIVAGKGKKTAEGSANDNEQNTFVKVTLSGNDFVKHVEVSYAEAKMSLPAFEKYLTTEIANSIGSAMAADAIEAIESGINAANKVTGSDYAAVCKAFGALKRANQPVVYCTRSTLYNQLVSMVDTAGQPIFQPSINEEAAGRLLGADIKIEDAIADGTILIGDPKKVVYNMVEDIMVETDKDIKAHKYIYSGYARGEGALIDDKAFAQITVA